MVVFNQSNQYGARQSLIKIGFVIAGIAVLNRILDEENDTVNYSLKYKGLKVYHGIAHSDRLDARLIEHECQGKVFDECIYDKAKPREVALGLELKRIQRDQTKYNIHHWY